MGKYDGFLQGMQVGGGLANTALDYLSANERNKLGEKELAQRGDIAAQNQAIQAMHYQQMMGSQQQQQELAKQKMLQDAMQFRMNQAQGLGKMDPSQLDQYNAAIAAFSGGQPQQQPPQASNAKIKVNSRGITYDGTVADAMMDAQHPMLGPILQQSVQNTMSAQAPHQQGMPGQVPISPMALQQYQRQSQMQDSEAMLKQQGMAQNIQQAQAAQMAKEAELRAGLAKMDPQQTEVYNAMMQQSPTQNSLLPGQVPVIRSREAPKLDAQQSQALGFAKRMALSENELSDVLKGYDPTTIRSWFQGMGMYPELAKSQDYKRFEQAAKNWAAAALRKESGAAISDSEYKGAMSQYFPQVNDSQDVIGQKVNSRNAYFDSMLADLPPYYREQVLKSRMNGGQSSSRNAPQEGAVIHQDGMNYMFKGGSFVPVQ